MNEDSHQKKGKQVIIFSSQKFKRVNIDRIAFRWLRLGLGLGHFYFSRENKIIMWLSVMLKLYLSI